MAEHFISREDAENDLLLGAAYLAESIPAWPSQKELAAIIGENEWAKVGWRNLSGGIVALHRATRR